MKSRDEDPGLSAGELGELVQVPALRNKAGAVGVFCAAKLATGADVSTSSAEFSCALAQHGPSGQQAHIHPDLFSPELS